MPVRPYNDRTCSLIKFPAHAICMSPGEGSGLKVMSFPQKSYMIRRSAPLLSTLSVVDLAIPFVSSLY